MYGFSISEKKKRRDTKEDDEALKVNASYCMSLIRDILYESFKD